MPPPPPSVAAAAAAEPAAAAAAAAPRLVASPLSDLIDLGQLMAFFFNPFNTRTEDELWSVVPLAVRKYEKRNMEQFKGSPM